MKQTLLYSVVFGTTMLLAAPDELRSVERATQLAALLDAQKLGAFAAEDPEATGRFAAVLYFPGLQILAIAGTYPVPELLRQRIAARQYREVYTDLSTAAAREGRFFVEDLGAPGLRPVRDEGRPFDITWRDTTTRVAFDGEWRGQKISEEQYQSRFAADDAEYAKLLQVLIAGLTAAPPASRDPAANQSPL